MSSQVMLRQQAAGTSVRRPSGCGFGDALHAEWTKLRTVQGTFWLLAAIAVLTIAVSIAAVAATSCPAGMTCPVDTGKLSLTGVQLGQAIVAILAVTAVCAEYSTGMMHVTLAAMPNRLVVLAAKASLVTCVVLVAGAIAVLGSVLAGGLILPGHGFTAARGFPVLSLADGTVLRAAVGSVLYLGLIALLSTGVAFLIRDSAVAIGSALALLYLFPILGSFIGDAQWQRRFDRWAPTTAGLAIRATTGLRSLPISPWSGLGVLAIWAAGALIAGGLMLRLRDA
jgi:ABC-2 type transport system permease protein